jgi:hypothetical protein
VWRLECRREVKPEDPCQVSELLGALDRTNIEIGYGGVNLFNGGEIAARQVGYSISSDGKNISGLEDGDWKPNWLAIGYETALGDPLFIDVKLLSLPVMTAMHGEGTWVPEIIATNLEGFFSILRRLAEIAQDGHWPVTAKEQEEFLSEVRRSKGDTAMDVFWRMQIGLEE